MFILQEKKLEHLQISLSDIEFATNNFSETCKMHASGPYCTWYRGVVDHFDVENYPSIEGKTKGEPSERHNTILIKRIVARDDEQGEQSLYTEIDMLTSVKQQT